MQQQTLAQKVSCTGLGLHTGRPVRLTLHPARVNSGIRLLRSDAREAQEIPVHIRSVSSTSHATTLGTGDQSVSTVEHLLASLSAVGVCNATIEVDGPEIPIMDGSADSFLHLIRAAGLYEQHESQMVLDIRLPIEVEDGERRISIEPAKHLAISYAVDFEHPAIGRQELHLPRLSAEVFAAELSRARTFGFLSELEALRRAGLGRGGSLGNTVVLDADHVLNPEGLRWPDEFVRHKIIDLIGDLTLVCAPLKGHVRVERGGHSLHVALAEAILGSPASWTAIGAESGSLPSLTSPAG